MREILFRGKRVDNDVADAVVFLPDWVESRGAGLEREYCVYIGKRIVN